jgi:hypothetical protein
VKSNDDRKATRKRVKTCRNVQRIADVPTVDAGIEMVETPETDQIFPGRKRRKRPEVPGLFRLLRCLQPVDGWKTRRKTRRKKKRRTAAADALVADPVRIPRPSFCHLGANLSL